MPVYSARGRKRAQPKFDESSPSGDNITVVSLPMWACGAAGSALPWHGRGHRFDPDQVHQSLQSFRQGERSKSECSRHGLCQNKLFWCSARASLAVDAPAARRGMEATFTDCRCRSSSHFAQWAEDQGKARPAELLGPMAYFRTIALSKANQLEPGFQRDSLKR